jgi:hypothetical protein
LSTSTVSVAGAARTGAAAVRDRAATRSEVVQECLIKEIVDVEEELAATKT